MFSVSPFSRDSPQSSSPSQRICPGASSQTFYLSPSSSPLPPSPVSPGQPAFSSSSAISHGSRQSFRCLSRQGHLVLLSQEMHGEALNLNWRCPRPTQNLWGKASLGGYGSINLSKPGGFISLVKMQINP